MNSDKLTYAIFLGAAGLVVGLLALDYRSDRREKRVDRLYAQRKQSLARRYRRA